VIADLFPPERRGRAYGFNAIGWSVGAVLGIVLGGLIVTYISWRWIFWINVPIGIAAVLLAVRVLRDVGVRRRHRLDVPGMVALGLGLFGVLWAVTELATSSLDAQILGYLLGGLILIASFAVIEWRQAEPMLNLSLLRIPTMTPSLLASFFQGLANFAVLFLVIMYLQGARRLSALDASLLLVPGYIIGGSVAPLAGRLTDRIGPVIPATFGLGVQVGALFIYAHLGIATGLWVVVAGSVVNGIGASSFFPANTSAVMKASPPQLFGISSGMLRTFANIGMVFSFSMAMVLASRTIPQHLAFAIFVGSTSLSPRLAGTFTDGLHAAFYGSMGLMVVAALLSASRGTARSPAEPGIAAPPGAPEPA
jgi:MFS family permease